MNKKRMIITSIVTLLPVLVGIVLWNKLPESIPVHWNFSGEIDRYSGKAFAVFFMPLLIFAIHLVCAFATRLDPKTQNLSSKVMGLVLWICPAVSVLCMGVCYAAALEYDVRVEFVIPLFVGIVFLLVGNYLPKCKRNSVVGIKVPWTLESEENWNKTHRFAGVVWTAGAVVVIIGSFFKNAVALTTFVPTAVMVIAPIVYSYVYYKSHKDEI